MIRFGHYYLPLPTPERGEIVVLDGMNGFTDQSLKGFYSGDELLFLINTGGDWAYPRWEALEVVRGELVEHPDILGCRIRVESVTTLGRLFREMPPSPTDAPELVGQERSYWRMHLQSVRRFRERGQEYPFEKRMSCLPSLREFDQAMTAGECRTRHYPEDLLYLHRQPAGRLRALYIGANEPESSVIFDLPGRDGYRTLLREALEVAEEPDERQGWEKLLG